jgi:hypothetical protein
MAEQAGMDVLDVIAIGTGWLLQVAESCDNTIDLIRGIVCDDQYGFHLIHTMASMARLATGPGVINMMPSISIMSQAMNIKPQFIFVRIGLLSGMIQISTSTS